MFSTLRSRFGAECTGPLFSRRRVLIALAGSLLAVGPVLVTQLPGKTRPVRQTASSGEPVVAVDKLVRSDADWRKVLTTDQYYVLREAGTEPAFDNRYHDHKGQGTYACVACGNRLFLSSAKFDSGTGWPSFFQPIDSGALDERPDNKLLVRRTEVICHRCEGHIGHVFQDGPQPTGLRYCLNSAALTFFPEK